MAPLSESSSDLELETTPFSTHSKGSKPAPAIKVKKTIPKSLTKPGNSNTTSANTQPTTDPGVLEQMHERIERLAEIEKEIQKVIIARKDKITTAKKAAMIAKDELKKAEDFMNGEDIIERNAKKVEDWLDKHRYWETYIALQRISKAGMMIGNMVDKAEDTSKVVHPDIPDTDDMEMSGADDNGAVDDGAVDDGAVDEDGNTPHLGPLSDGESSTSVES